METDKKVSKQVNKNFVKERFSFELTINDNIICQRYFRINGFKSQSLYSEELLDTLNYCANIIRADLKDKTQMFNWYTAPQIFKSEKQMWLWFDTRPFDIEEYRYICLEDSEQVYFWDGENIEPYSGYFNRTDYLPNNEAAVSPCILKLTFFDNDKPVCSTSWDGNIYPRFIRTNIDLSNSKNKYKEGNVFSPMEFAMVGMLNETHKDLIPIIVKEFCVCCSSNSKYTTSLEYGKKTYSLNTENLFDKKMSVLEKILKKKTDKYFNSIKF